MNFVDHAKLMEAAEALRHQVPVEPHAAPPSTARADFLCAHCTKLAGGVEVRWTDLPADALRCPRCGHKRGFKRLFDAVGVSTKGHRAAQIIDPPMTRAFDHHSSIKQGARAAEAMGIRGHGIPAGAALAAIDSAGRAASRDIIMPIIQDRRVRPAWVK